MIAEQLKKSLLQAAIQGKLTEQLPEDGNAKDLLKEILIEKDHLIREGKIKKEKPLLKISDDEIPFEIPENWCWVRIGAITNINPRNNIDDETTVSFIPMTLLNDGYSNTFTHEKRLWKNVKSGFTHFSNNDVVIAKITPCFQNRKSAVMRGLINGYGAGTTELHVIRPISNLVLSDYLLYFFKTEYFIGDGVLSMTGTAGQQRVGKEYVQKKICPIPPIAEQRRIVNKLTELIPEIVELEKDETKLDTLQKSFPKEIKESIIQAAIHGKLTEQLKSDGDACELVKEIQKEKAQLINEGKIKKEKPLPEITDDEIPFEIPENWCWVRLESLSEPCDYPFADGPFGSNLKSEHYTDRHEVRIVQLSNIGENGWRDDNTKYTTYKHLEKIARSEVKVGDIVIAKMMPAGRAIEVPGSENRFVLSSDAIKFVPNRMIDKSFILYSINSDSFRRQIYLDVHGITRIRTSLSKIKTYHIPLPPLAEQHRIVERLKELLPLCDVLE